jgi:hypothetical protein
MKCKNCRFFTSHLTSTGPSYLGECGIELPRWVIETLHDGHSHAVREDDGCDLGQERPRKQELQG